MASFLYTVLCSGLAALAAAELRTRNRTAHIQTYLTLLGALVFCGVSALLVTAAKAADGAYQSVAAFGFLVLTVASLYAVARVSRRFRALGAASRENF